MSSGTAPRRSRLPEAAGAMQPWPNNLTAGIERRELRLKQKIRAIAADRRAFMHRF